MKNPIRIVTAASLFDGHDASINIMRRILQDKGAEVIHLGHNRSVKDIVQCILQEGAQGVAISSYQGGHMKYFKYMKDLLKANGADYVKIFGGGGGVIIHEEKRELEAYGITQIFHPEDGRRLGLEGMIQMIIDECDFSILDQAQSFKAPKEEILKAGGEYDRDLGLHITALELHKNSPVDLQKINKNYEHSRTPVLGVTGTGGAGKSSLIDEVILRFRQAYPEKNIAVVCVDPTKQKTGGSLLGDRIRMNSLSRGQVFMRSLASRGSGNEISKDLPLILEDLKTRGFDLIIAESSGTGQSSHAITEFCDLSLYVMTSEFGAQSQLEKIEMIDFADLIAINKADRQGALDALRDVKKQYVRSRKLFHQDVELPVFLTQASNFCDEGVNTLFEGLTKTLTGLQKNTWELTPEQLDELRAQPQSQIVPAERKHYLSDVVSKVKAYHKKTAELCVDAKKLEAIEVLKKQEPELLNSTDLAETKLKESLLDVYDDLKSWDDIYDKYQKTKFVYKVRQKEVHQSLKKESLSGTAIPRVSLPQTKSYSELTKFLRSENLPGYFPYTAGVFPLKREGEDPTRQFAGEGPPEKTNKRFHYLSEGQPAKRLSTAFDSVTLYGEDPDLRPDIFGKVGESGVSIATLDDMKRLYEGFDLCAPKTSVSMTINGPAPMILAFFMNTAIDQKQERLEKELGRSLTDEEKSQSRAEALASVRGTVQADILKEDQGQNTCIFSIDFALKMMGDIQEYFINNKVRNFYSVSISGYHIAEAGANPITQLALTLSNAFTYVEYYKSRGMKVDDFAPNLSFFFSNGMDPEYAVLGRVARRIWAIAMKDLYGAGARAQKLKYHIQTSGRSLHAQEIQFNDIRTTLQALMAVTDQCNSLHTNAYDEAITTPTEESVRRAQAIQLIINHELGPMKNENSLQGSYFYEWLTDTVEESVLKEFLKISERGGVLGAMETGYQRSQIQEESMHYETLKHDGTLPLIGVNTYIDPDTQVEGYEPPSIELARCSDEDKQLQYDRVKAFQKANTVRSTPALKALQQAALKNENIFEALMDASRVCTLGQMTEALYKVGGQYRRNL